MIEFTVPGEPVPKGRPRVRIMKMGGKSVPNVYTPTETRAAEAAFRALASPYRPRKPLEGPLHVELSFVVQPPAHIPRDRSKRWPHIKPDADNFAKLALDSMNGVFFHDDGQICRLTISKMYGNDPRTDVRIIVLGEADETQQRLI